MSNLRSICDLARTAGFAADAGERRAAFAILVARHRSLVMAKALRQLGNRARAEEAAQEAFLHAWERIGELREPAAFAAWLLRIVSTVCHRVRRKEPGPTVPLDHAAGLPALEPDARDHLEAGRRWGALGARLDRLTQRQHQAAVLHYLDDHSIAEIAGILGIEEPALAKRLHDARQRLRNVDDVSVAPPRRGVSGPRVRSCAPPAGRAVLPRLRRCYVAEEAGSRRSLAHGILAATPFRPIYRIDLDADGRALRAGAGDCLLARLLEDLAEVDATSVWLRVRADATELISWLRGRGFRESERRWELCARTSRAPQTVAGVTITSLEGERQRAPGFVPRLRALLDELRRADPTRPFVPLPLATVERWLRTGSLALETGFLARRGERYIGHLDMRPLEVAQGALAVNQIGVVPDEQRHGVASALVGAAIAMARARGVRELRAFACPVEESTLALFETLGFERVVPHVTLERCLRTAVAVDPATLDAYRGGYRFAPAGKPAATFTVTRHRDTLVTHINDCVDHWLASPSGWFFVKEHYGQIRFERGAGGRVTALRYRDGEGETLAPRID